MIPSLQIASQGLLGPVSPTLLAIAMQGFAAAASVAPSGQPHQHWYITWDRERRKKEKKHVRSFQDMLADAQAARAARAARAERAAELNAPDHVQPIAKMPLDTYVEPAAKIVIPAYHEVYPIYPSPVYRTPAPAPSPRPRITLPPPPPRPPKIPEKIRKQRLAMNTLVLALSIMED